MSGRAIATLAGIAVGVRALAGAQGRGGRGIPDTTPEQAAAVARLTAEVAPHAERLAAARTDLIAATLATSTAEDVIRSKVEAVRAAELEVAKARSDALARLQGSAARLSPAQLGALGAASSGGRGAGGRGYRTSMPHVSAAQSGALLEMTSALQPKVQALTAARASGRRVSRGSARRRGDSHLCRRGCCRRTGSRQSSRRHLRALAADPRTIGDGTGLVACCRRWSLRKWLHGAGADGFLATVAVMSRCSTVSV